MSDSKQPFEDKDVLWRWTPERDLVDEFAFVSHGTERRMYIRVGQDWQSNGSLSMPIGEMVRQRATLEEAKLDAVAARVQAENDMAVLRGQLTAKDAEIAKLTLERDELQVVVASGRDADTIRSCTDEIKQHGAELIAAIKQDSSAFASAVAAERKRIVDLIEQQPCYCREMYTCTRCEILAAVQKTQEEVK